MNDITIWITSKSSKQLIIHLPVPPSAALALSRASPQVRGYDASPRAPRTARAAPLLVPAPPERRARPLPHPVAHCCEYGDMMPPRTRSPYRPHRALPPHWGAPRSRHPPPHRREYRDRDDASPRALPAAPAPYSSHRIPAPLLNAHQILCHRPHVRQIHPRPCLMPRRRPVIRIQVLVREIAPPAPAYPPPAAQTAQPAQPATASAEAAEAATEAVAEAVAEAAGAGETCIAVLDTWVYEHYVEKGEGGKGGETKSEAREGDEENEKEIEGGEEGSGEVGTRRAGSRGRDGADEKGARQ
ncbi:hypothetical protein DFH09DRAFT_1504281 [Mycena vulgaris]|nr:hypothetical protein DFH09DRAFT_1504281 [Mycena vulgaris]